MKIKYLLPVLGLVLFISCKKEKNEQQSDNIEVVKKSEANKSSNTLSLELSISAKKTDTISLFFLNEGDTKISKERSFKNEIKGENNLQTIKFEFPESVIPTKIILKFSPLITDNEIGINSAKFKLENEEFIIQSERFTQFFNPNKFIEYSEEDNRFTTKKMEGNYNPAFYSREVLTDKLYLTF